METLQWSSRSPIGVIVIAIFVTLLGLLSLWRLPLQLFPDIKRPELSIQTNWRTASPEEVESELLEPLENVMQGLPGVEEIEGNGDTNETLSWFFVQLLPGTAGPMDAQRRFIEDTVRARLEAIPGVASVNVNAGPPDEV